jgi:hypothetical protein
MDFFKLACQTGPHSETEFGICDDQDGGVAFVDKVNSSKWVAKVKNKDAIPVVFTAIDKCVIADGELPGHGRCDGMLTADHLLYLVELKDQRQRWREHAIQQLISTIKLLAENKVDLKKYTLKKAFACNRAHPHFVEIDHELQMRFFRGYGFRVDMQAEVLILS